jgi:hypothetical protein
MDWIKKNYDQFLLVLAAVGLLGVAVLLMQRAQGFGDRFAAALVPGMPKKNVPPLELTPVDKAKETLEAPVQWKPGQEVAHFLVAKRYIIDPQSKTPKQLSDVGFHRDSLTGETIPNQWFIDNRLDPLNAAIALEDTDKDGFLNEDEWRGKSDPNNADVHPQYVSKLFLVSWIKVPFRLLFNAVDGNPKKDKPEKLEFQINTVDLRQPSEFLKLGQMVSRTKFKLKSFEFKEVPDPNAGTKDVSELTLENTETGETIVLVKEKVTDSPDSFGLFEYKHPQPPTQIRVKKLQEFVLLPEKDKKYKLVDIKETEAVISLPSGEKLTVKPDPRTKR